MKGGGPPKDPPVPAELVTVEVGPLRETLEAIGTLEADEYVNLRPEVDGEITSIQMTEGDTVKKGDLLFQIDESKQAAAVAEAVTQARAEAKAKLAEALAKADKDKKAAIDKEVKMALADAAKAKAQESAAAAAVAPEKKPS